MHSLFSGKDRDLKIQRQRVLYRGLTEVFDSSLLLSFEKESFEVPILYQEYLKNTYGDYMQLPPVEKRIGHSFEAYWKI